MTCNKKLIEERRNIKDHGKDAYGYPNDQKWIPDSSGGYPYNNLKDEYEYEVGLHQYDDC